MTIISEKMVGLYNAMCESVKEEESVIDLASVALG